MVAGGFAATAIVLHLAGTLLIRAMAPLAKAKSFALRHAVLQLSRPGSQMRIVLLAVGLGSFFIIGVRSLQENLIAQFAVNINPESPDMFLLDIQRDQVEPVRAAIAAHQAAGRRAAAPAAGVARPRGRRRGPRDQSRGLRRRARPRLARPRIHHHLSRRARAERDAWWPARSGSRRRRPRRKCRSSSSSTSRSRSTSATRCASTCWAA